MAQRKSYTTEKKKENLQSFYFSLTLFFLFTHTGAEKSERVYILLRMDREKRSTLITEFFFRVF